MFWMEKTTNLEMSNYNHTIDGGLESLLKNNPNALAYYYAWNFLGKVSYKDKLFICEILIHNQHVNTLQADNLLGIMNQACELYGSN